MRAKLSRKLRQQKQQQEIPMRTGKTGAFIVISIG